MDILVVPPNPIWQDEFAVEAKQISVPPWEILLSRSITSEARQSMEFSRSQSSTFSSSAATRRQLISEQKE